MPFDGIEFNEVTEQLKAAKQVLIKDGWCTHYRIDYRGRHCALGALDAVEYPNKKFTYVTDTNLSVRRLSRLIPAEYEFSRPQAKVNPANRVADYNNHQTSIEPILEWFDRAIGE